MKATMDKITVPTCTESEFLESLALSDKYVPLKAPMGWSILPPFPVGSPLFGVKSFHRTGDKLVVLCTASRWTGDLITDRVWLHVSLSRANRMPSYQDMCDVKSLFIGPDRKAHQVFAEESQHVNIHAYCLHL